MPANSELHEVDDLATLESGLDALETSVVSEKRFTPKRVALKVAPCTADQPFKVGARVARASISSP